MAVRFYFLGYRGRAWKPVGIRMLPKYKSTDHKNACSLEAPRGPGPTSGGVGWSEREHLEAQM